MSKLLIYSCVEEVLRKQHVKDPPIENSDLNPPIYI